MHFGTSRASQRGLSRCHKCHRKRRFRPQRGVHSGVTVGQFAGHPRGWALVGRAGEGPTPWYGPGRACVQACLGGTARRGGPAAKPLQPCTRPADLGLGRRWRMHKAVSRFGPGSPETLLGDTPPMRRTPPGPRHGAVGSRRPFDGARQGVRRVRDSAGGRVNSVDSEEGQLQPFSRPRPRAATAEAPTRTAAPRSDPPKRRGAPGHSTPGRRRPQAGAERPQR